MPLGVMASQSGHVRRASHTPQRRYSNTIDGISAVPLSETYFSVDTYFREYRWTIETFKPCHLGRTDPTSLWTLDGADIGSSVHIPIRQAVRSPNAEIALQRNQNASGTVAIVFICDS